MMIFMTISRGLGTKNGLIFMDLEWRRSYDTVTCLTVYLI